MAYLHQPRRHSEVCKYLRSLSNAAVFVDDQDICQKELSFVFRQRFYYVVILDQVCWQVMFLSGVNGPLGRLPQICHLARLIILN